MAAEYRYRGATRFWDRSRGSFRERPPAVFERYEYRCPWCKHLNVRYERMGRIVCSKCGRGFSEG